MAEINKRNLVDETAKVYAANTLANEPTPLFSTGMPAKIIRASIANTNLLSKDGDLFVGTGSIYTETIDGTEYTYAKIAKKNQSELFVNGLNSTATNVGLAASVGKFIDSRLYLTGSNSTTDAIGIGSGANAEGQSSIALGVSAVVSLAGTNSIQLGSGTNETAMSFQVGNHQMLDLNTGKMPIERINATGTPTSLVIGGSSSGTDTDCVAYGFNSDVGGMGSVAIGYGASVLFDGGVAIGKNAKLDSQGIPKNCIAIGNEANVTYESTEESGTAIQLGTGTNSTGGFQVWDYQLMDKNGTIPSERRPIYKCTVKYPNSYSVPISPTSPSVNVYYLIWYSSTPTIPTDFFVATGYRETISPSIGGNTESTFSPCCGKIHQNIHGKVVLVALFDPDGTEVAEIDKSKITSDFELI